MRDLSHLLTTLPPVCQPVPAVWEPVQTLYGGAHLFRSDRFLKIGAQALRALEEHDPDGTFFGEETHRALRRKLESEPIEDYRIDFEDGFGERSDEEEDRFAVSAARELGKAERRPRRIGLRIRSLGTSPGRALRTLALFFESLSIELDLRVTLPKVESPLEVRVLRQALRELGARRVEVELMVESPSALARIPSWLEEAEGLCRAIHFGPYDFMASCGLIGGELHHPLCTAARAQILFALEGTGVAWSDGPTTLLPLPAQRAVVQAAWAAHRADLRRSWGSGYTQSWDLHPVQLVSHYAEVYARFQGELPHYRARLASFQAASRQAVTTTGHFDDAATVRLLRNFFERALALGFVERTPELEGFLRL